MPPRQAAKGAVADRASRRARPAVSTLPPAASASASGGKSARSDRRSTSPAWIPPSSGWAIRPRERLAEAARGERADRFVVGAAGRPPGRRSRRRRGRARRPRASSGHRPRRASGAGRGAYRGGSACSRPSRQHERGARRFGRDESSPRPSSRQSASAAGFCASIESGPPSIEHAVDVLGADHPAEARSRFEHQRRPPAAMDVARQRQAGEPAADHGDVDGDGRGIGRPR